MKSPDLASQKRLLRDELRQSLRGVTGAMQSSVQARVGEFLQDHKGETWAAFWPLPGEPNLIELFETMKQIRWVFPRIQGERLVFHTTELGWSQGPLGLREPKAANETFLMTQLAGVLVPGLGFDRKGQRLGRGRGFYDRMLQGYTGLIVGVCFELQMRSEIPTSPQDKKMQWILTDQNQMSFSEGEWKWN